MKKIKKSVQSCTISLLVNGVELSGSGDSFEEALSCIIPPAKVNTKATMRVTIGGETKERMIRGWQMMKLFHPNPLMREMVLKNFKILFGF